jgi:hypothetical protein
MLHGYLRTKMRKLQREWKEERQITWDDLVKHIGESDIEGLSDARKLLLKDAWFRMTTQRAP